MTIQDPKATLVETLQQGRDAVLWKLDDLDEYDVRRPLTPTGTNLLGLVKHLAGVELGYFGDTFGRPSGIALPWYEDGADDNDDLWVTPDESRGDIVALYHAAWAHAAETFAACELDTLGRVPHWPAEREHVSLHQVLVHVTAETHRHAGHADIVRETLDGRAGRRPDDPNMVGRYDWPAHVARVEEAARAAGTTAADGA
jgi:hypothetical protein